MLWARWITGRAVTGTVSTEKKIAAAPISLNVVMRFIPWVRVRQITDYAQNFRP
jgi:hypothetical protein